jgi:uncharacterized membrane protein YbhN (UPF0104 family)
MKIINKKNIYSFIKLIIAFTALIFIYYKLKDFNFTYSFNGSKLYLLIFSILLLFDNWGVESLKWQFLVKKYEQISLFKAYKSVFSGVASSVFIPNRVGEFVGRMFYISDENKGKAILSTIVGSYSQLLITIILGLLAFFISKPIIVYNIEINSSFNNFILIVLTCILLLVYFKISIFSYLINKIKFLSRFKDLFQSLELYSSLDLFKVLLLSLLRYTVFAVQFVLIVYFFNIEISLINIILGIAQFYLVLLIIPTVSFAEPGVRAVIAISVFSQYTNSIDLVVYSISVLWLINIVIPAFIGSILLSINKS